MESEYLTLRIAINPQKKKSLKASMEKLQTDLMEGGLKKGVVLREAILFAMSDDMRGQFIKHLKGL